MDKDVPAVADALPPVFSPEQVERDNPPTTDVTVRPLRQYTNEARAYHSRYTEASLLINILQERFELTSISCLRLTTAGTTTTAGKAALIS